MICFVIDDHLIQPRGNYLWRKKFNPQLPVSEDVSNIALKHRLI